MHISKVAKAIFGFSPRFARAADVPAGRVLRETDVAGSTEFYTINGNIPYAV